MLIDQLITLVQTKVAGFGRRELTFEDFLTAADAEDIVVEVKRHPLDEQLLRKPLAKIVLNAGLSERYRTFVGFHALAHWFGHPGRSEFYLGSPGWLDTIELEASTIGLLAIVPHPRKPYPRLVNAQTDDQQMEFEVEYPEGQDLWVAIPRRGNKVRKQARWKTRRLVLPRTRVQQTEFRWEAESP